jgi:hypothetical protein
MIPTPRYRTTVPEPASTNTSLPPVEPLLSPTPPQGIETLSVTGTLDTSTPASNDWMELPVIPSINPDIGEIYQRGLQLGNDPHAFSIFGDCQTHPGEFLGVYETDQLVYDALSPELQETVSNFEGSFTREGSTSQDGTTPGALLWTQWHRGEYGCTALETPVDCELRVHRPSFVIIQIGTHFESRNIDYLRTIIDQLLLDGVVPILATKADNSELDNRINREMAMLAAEYDLPLWNFWASLSGLVGRGLYVKEGREDQGAVYLNEEASELHRMTGLLMLDAVWRAATGQ